MVFRSRRGRLSRMPRFFRMLVTIAAVVCAAPALATILAPVSLSELAADAVTVAYGRVARVEVTDNERGVETLVTLAGVAVMKGDETSAVTFGIPGGRVGRYTTVMVGAPVLQPGDEIVVFLSGGPVARLVGFSQGLVRVVRSAPGATPMVLAPPSAADGTTRRIARGSAGRFMTLAAFVQDVHDLVAQTATRRGRDRRAAVGGAAGW